MSVQLSRAKAAIANGASLSTQEVDLGAHEVVAIQMPASWTAANLTFQGHPNMPDPEPASPLQDVYDSGGTEVTVTAAAGHYIVLTPAHRDALAGLDKIKVRSGTTGVPVNQGAARELIFVLALRRL